MSDNVVVIASERLARYGFADGHPFGPDRHAAFLREFGARALDRKVRVLEPRVAPKPGRNDPCPCGSGKKFKKCCGA